MAWNTIPDFGDKNAKTNKWIDEPSGAAIAEVLYDAHDTDGNPITPDPESTTDGHGRWLAIQINETWQIVSWQHPRKSGGKTDYGFRGTTDALGDIAADMNRKADLVNKARDITATNDYSSVNSRKMNEFMESWRKIRSWHVPREDALWNEFHTARHDFYEGRDAMRAQAKVAKEAIATEAEKVLAEQDFRNGSSYMRKLMERWKKIPSAGRSDDQTLWKRFNDARNEFFRAQHENYKKRQIQMSDNLTRKQSLIEHAKQITAAHDYSRGATDEMRALTSEWKQLGSAGREHDNDLWTQFHTAQQPFWDERRRDRERNHAEWEKRHAAWCTRMEKVIAGKERDAERVEDEINYLEFKKTTAEGASALANIERQLRDARDHLSNLRTDIDDIRKQMKT